MSILPLANSSADQPGHNYQASIGGTAPASVASSGLFTRFKGPFGVCPVQLFGMLLSGEAVYFRARGKKVEMEIKSAPHAEPHAHYVKLLDVNHELGTGILPNDICVEYINRWLADYISRCPAKDQPFRGKSYVENEAESSLVLDENMA